MTEEYTARRTISNHMGEFMDSTMGWMNLTDIMLSERGQKQNCTFGMRPLFKHKKTKLLYTVKSQDSGDPW